MSELAAFPNPVVYCAAGAAGPRVVGVNVAFDDYFDRLADRLTDKQRTVFRTAYLADHFESPRETSAEEPARTLGVSGPTVLYHLRRTRRKTAGWLLEE